MRDQEMPRDWRYYARCLEEDPELFFPVPEMESKRLSAADRANGVKPSPVPSEQSVEASKVCAKCPVIEDCLKWAIDNDIRDGIWGGQTSAQRQQIKRQWRTR